MRHGTMLLLTLLAFSFVQPAHALARNPAPGVPRGSIKLEKTGFELSFNRHHKQADWVFYSLGPDQLVDCEARPGHFRADPELPDDVSPTLADYRGSGYDRGHLSPAGDNKWSYEAISDSFLLSNVSPQPAGFNRGIWENLESLVRAWAEESGGLWVTTGPVLDDGLDTIGDSEISVPREFYKVLLTKKARHRSAIAFRLPVDAEGDLADYAVSVRSVEEATGLDFLKGLDGREERELETGLDLSGWDFEAKFTYSPCRLRTVPGFSAAAPQGLAWFHELN